MPNLFDYLTWRSDLSLSVVPFSDVDSLLLSTFAYCIMDDMAAGPEGAPLAALPHLLSQNEDETKFFGRCHRLQTELGRSVRFGELTVHHGVEILDPEREMQFAAMTIDLPDGRAYVAFRGTDSTFVGWREDFAMSYESVVPAQQEALTYLERIGLTHPKGILLGGHSKGGNLAVFAAAHASHETQALLQGIWSFDGPGLSEEILHDPGYGRIRGLIHSFIPNSSIVGLLLGYNPEYTVVRSTAVSIGQHDPFTWQLAGPRFEEVQQVDASSQFVDETLHEWLVHSTREQREHFVETVFTILESTGATTFQQLFEEKFRSASAIVAASLGLDRETKRMLIRLMAQLIRIGTANLWERLMQRPLVMPPKEETEERL